MLKTKDTKLREITHKNLTTHEQVRKDNNAMPLLHYYSQHIIEHKE